MTITKDWQEILLGLLIYVPPLCLWVSVIFMGVHAFRALMASTEMLELVRYSVILWVAFRLEYHFRNIKSEKLYEAAKVGLLRRYIKHPFFDYFKAMVDVYELHEPVKGDSWRHLLWTDSLTGVTKQMEDMHTDPHREDYWANIGNYAAMAWLNELTEEELMEQ